MDKIPYRSNMVAEPVVPLRSAGEDAPEGILSEKPDRSTQRSPARAMPYGGRAHATHDAVGAAASDQSECASMVKVPSEASDDHGRILSTSLSEILANLTHESTERKVSVVKQATEMLEDLVRGGTRMPWNVGSHWEDADCAQGHPPRLGDGIDESRHRRKGGP